MKGNVLVTGGSGFLGKVLVERLRAVGYQVTAPSSRDFNLLYPGHIDEMFEISQPDIVIHAAAKVGGILFNQQKPAELFYHNIMMGVQMMEAARFYNVSKYVQIGTVCEYPKFTDVPFLEEDLWNGYPEETNAPYGIAKKALLVQGQAYRQQYGLNVIHLLPVNLYGPGDNFHLKSSHVIPGLIVRISEAIMAGLPSVSIGGSGMASREFLYVDDAADAILKAVAMYDKPEPINIGSGVEISIESLARLIAVKLGYEGQIVCGANIPEGQPRRRLDVQKAKKEFDFTASTNLSDGLDKTIKWYQENK
jgi:GDP-L-fucose synthase